MLSSTIMATPPPAGRYGGLERVVADLAGGLAARGHDVDLVAHPDSRPPEGVNLLPYDTSSGRPVFGLRGHQGHRVEEYDIIHGHDWDRLTWRLAVAHPDQNFHQTWHGPHIGTAAGWAPPPPNVRMIGVSGYNAWVLGAELGVPVLSAHNGVPLEDYPFYDGAREDYLLYCARIDPCKGLYLAMDLADRVGMRLVVAGPEHVGSDPDYTRAMLARMDGHRVWYAGDLGLAEKVRLMQRARALLWTAPEFLEPFGLGIVEAAACGTPTVAFATGAPAELLADCHGGALITRPEEFPAALGWALELPRAGIRRFAERYSVDAMVERYLELYGGGVVGAGVLDRPDHATSL